jgi:hypothetical protein
MVLNKSTVMTFNYAFWNKHMIYPEVKKAAEKIHSKLMKAKLKDIKNPLQFLNENGEEIEDVATTQVSKECEIC